MPKQKQKKYGALQRTNHVASLGEQLKQHDQIKPKRVSIAEGSDEEDKMLVDPSMTAKILKQARLQQLELEDELSLDSGDADDQDETNSLDDFATENVLDNSALDEEDSNTVSKWLDKSGTDQPNLGDIIAEKLSLAMKEDNLDKTSVVSDIDPKVVDLYTGIKNILCKYRSGKLPKALKALPLMRNWERLLLITVPSNWTAAAVFGVTRIFAMSSTDAIAQRFNNCVVLPRIRDDIAEFGRLNPHLYNAIKKSLYRPAAFIRGILIPLLNESATIREAAVLSSVIERCSIPVLHASAAMLLVAELPYSPANCFVLRTLINKKYALPYRCLDAILYFFLNVKKAVSLPVMWHQCLLVFVQRYKNDLSPDQRSEVLKLIKLHSHHQISPEIRRELNSAESTQIVEAMEDDNS